MKGLPPGGRHFIGRAWPDNLILLKTITYDYRALRLLDTARGEEFIQLLSVFDQPAHGGDAMASPGRLAHTSFNRDTS